MPKYKLKRSTADRRVNKTGGSISNVYKEPVKKGVEQFEKPSSDVISSVDKDGDQKKGQIHNLFEGIPVEIVFNGKGQAGGLRLPQSYEVKIYESMDQHYRYGELVLHDQEGLMEFTSLYNTYDGEQIEVYTKTTYEGEKFRKFTFSLYDCKVENLDGNDLEKKTRKITYKMYEEPFFVNYHKNSHGDSYKENTAIEIVNNLLASRIGSESIKVVKGDKDPILPSFIIPNWSVKKTIQYLQNYVDGGPLKVFNISKGEDTITIVAPLTKFIDGKVYPNEFTLAPSSTQFTKNSMKLGKYEIWGINEMQEINFLRGETTMSFDYMYGDEDKKGGGITNFTDFPVKGKDKYTYNEGESEYEITKRTHGAVLSGKYTEGLKKTKHLGSFTTHIKDDTSQIDHIYSMDVDPKPLIQTKQLNRFASSYFDSFMLHTVLPHSGEINVGQLFNILIPSTTQPSDPTVAFLPDETLSGKWMLWKMEHSVRFVKDQRNPTNSGRVMYELHCYFVKTSYEKSNRIKNDKNV
jgi:hypothetical protein